MALFSEKKCYRYKMCDFIMCDYFYKYISSGKDNKNKQMGIPQTKKLLHSKENFQKNKKTIH